MDRKARQRVMRSFMAALLQSDLSLEELRQLSFDISEGFFAEELSKLLEEAIFAVRGVPPYESKSAPETAENFANAIIQRRRLSKKAVLDLIANASLRKTPRGLNTADTLREILRKFFRTASPPEIAKFIDQLDSGETTEAYLRGISRRD